MLGKAALAASAATCVAIVVKSKSLVTATPMPKFELCQVQVIFRHGARTPLHVPPYIPAVTYEESLLDHSPETKIQYELVSISGDDQHPKSPFEESYKKTGALRGGAYPGQLTHIGADQTFQLGAYLRKRYLEELEYLNPANLSQQIYTRSTNVTRTIMSARCVLAGLLAGENVQDPLKIHISPANDEVLYPNYYTCVHLKHLLRWAWDEPHRIPGIQNIQESLRALLKFPSDTKVDLVMLRDNFAVEATHKKPSMKSQLSSDTIANLEDGAMRVMKTAFIGAEDVRGESLKLAIGPFVDILVRNMENVRDGRELSSTKLRLYSGHDTTLIPLLAALGIEFSTWPRYASNVILELYRKADVRGRDGDEGNYFVKMFYNGKQHRIGRCSDNEPCPLEEFQRTVEHVRIQFKEYKNLCKVN